MYNKKIAENKQKVAYVAICFSQNLEERSEDQYLTTT